MRAHHSKKLFAGPELAVVGGAKDIDLSVRAFDDGAERRSPHLPRLTRKTSAILVHDRDRLMLERKRRAIEEIVISDRRVCVEGVDLRQERIVVRRGPAEVTIEAADHAERSADA